MSNSLDSSIASDTLITDENDLKNRQSGIEANDKNHSFFSIVSHNIKNPFASLLGFSELLFNDFDELNEEERKFYVSEIKKSADSTYNYVEKFFEWIYYKSGKIKLNFVNINLSECIFDVLNQFNKRYKENIEVNAEVDPNIVIHADEDSIKKVLFNILENAIKFSDKDPTIQISTEKIEEKGKVKVEITDNGIGINKVDLAKIFNITEDPSLIGQSENKGAGISLILTRELVELNNGTIKIKSNLGEGSTFSICLEGK
ncbi:MAG: HAMP domain-containing histidine kinase [Ignavibacteriae bacterium]|nr:HAMP domain-containing histidine kinase [Ignavibacteriota bacterium]